MSKYSPIPIRKATRPEYDKARGEDKHDQFVRKLLAVWSATPPSERAQILARQAQGG